MAFSKFCIFLSFLLIFGSCSRDDSDDASSGEIQLTGSILNAPAPEQVVIEIFESESNGIAPGDLVASIKVSPESSFTARFDSATRLFEIVAFIDLNGDLKCGEGEEKTLIISSSNEEVVIDFDQAEFVNCHAGAGRL